MTEQKPANPDDESAVERSARTKVCICTSTERLRNRPFQGCAADVHR